MGNYRFRLSDMMPNAWFYKLRDMSKTRNHNNTILSRKKKQPTSASASASTSSAVSSQSQPSKPNQPHNPYPRKSYYFTRELVIPTDPNPKSPDPPRKSTRQQRIKRRSAKYSSSKVVSSSVSAGCSCRATTTWNKPDSPAEYSASPSDISFHEAEQHESLFPPEFRSDSALGTESFDNMVSWASCKIDSNVNDIVISVDKQSLARKSTDKMDVDNYISDLDLPPIITKPVIAKFDNELENINKKNETQEQTMYRRSSVKGEANNAHGSLSIKVVKEESVTMKEHKMSSFRRNSANSPGVRLRVNSPRIASRRIPGRRSASSTTSSCSRRSLSDSLAIVKSSFDPQRDFRDSMMEMIVENDIRASKDLEDLLACYLQLNSDKYHDLIIKVFKQIWFDLTSSKSKS